MSNTPKVNAGLVDLVARLDGAVVVWEDGGTVYAVERLTGPQAEDPRYVVILDHEGATRYISDTGSATRAALAVNVLLASAVARGLM